MRAALLLLALPLWSCQTASSGPPEEVAGEIVFALENDERDKADDLIGRMPEGDRETMYPVLFTAAEERFGQGDSAGSAGLLRFMAKHYDSAIAVREALLFALFVERSQVTVADAALLGDIEETLSFIKENDQDAPVWVNLVETQQRIDQDRLPEAREAFDRFLSEWDGNPTDLIVYVEDINRYLTSH